MEGVGTPEAIDTVMKLGMNHPMGPLTLADFIGLDVCLAILNVLHEGLGDPEVPAVSPAPPDGGGRPARPQDRPRLLSTLAVRPGSDSQLDQERVAAKNNRKTKLAWHWGQPGQAGSGLGLTQSDPVDPV